MHELLAETFWKDSFSAIDAMLWDARLSPAFWVDALDYYVYLLNRTPHDHLGGDMAPLQKVTGRRPRWDHLRTFGCDVYVHIPNNDLAKVPGVPKGKKYIFVGFSQDKNGLRFSILNVGLTTLLGIVTFTKTSRPEWMRCGITIKDEC